MPPIDPYAPAPMDVNEWLQYWNSSPQVQAGGTNSGMTSKEALAALNALSDQLGVPIAALLGGTVGQDTAQPSKTGMVYGSNPLYGAMFKLMDAGDDPITAFNKVKKEQQDNKTYGEDVNFDDPDFSKDLRSIAEQYKFETVNNQNEAKDSYTVGGKKYKGSGDILARKSAFELMGSPDEESIIQQYAKTKAKAPSSVKDLFSRSFKDDATADIDPRRAYYLRQAAPQVQNLMKNTMISSDANQNLARQLYGLKAIINPMGG